MKRERFLHEYREMLILTLFLFISAITSRKAKLLGRNVETLIPNHYIVVFQNGMKSAQFSEEIRVAKLQFGDRMKHVYKHAIQGFSVQIDPISRELETLRRNPNIEYYHYFSFIFFS